MLKPISKQTLARDLAVIQGGFCLFGLSIALAIRANLGTGTWSVLEVALAPLVHLSVGTVSILVGFIALGIALLLREPIGWGTLANLLSIGPWLDLWLWILPSVQGVLPLQIVMLLAGILIQGIASAIYIGVNAGAGPRDSLMLAIHRTTHISIRLARGAIEVGVFLLGWALGGPAGVGTVVFALLIGPAVQWAFRLFRVKPHHASDGQVAATGAQAEPSVQVSK
jgi:uncharacterized membrane protein YczE